MTKTWRSTATAELLLIFPAILFMVSLFVREIQPARYEPAQTANRIVGWYAAQPRIGLWLLLIAMPLACLILGCITLIRAWKGNPYLRHTAGIAFTAVRAYFSTLFVASATVAAFGILVVVALHMITG